jgi:hypothetical protein
VTVSVTFPYRVVILNSQGAVVTSSYFEDESSARAYAIRQERRGYKARILEATNKGIQEVLL